MGQVKLRFNRVKRREFCCKCNFYRIRVRLMVVRGGIVFSKNLKLYAASWILTYA